MLPIYEMKVFTAGTAGKAADKANEFFAKEKIIHSITAVNICHDTVDRVSIVVTFVKDIVRYPNA